MPLTRNQSNAASQAKLVAANNTETSTSKESNDQGGTSTEAEPPRRDSPENCSICLGPFNNKSFTSSCAHSFCFVCLKQWSKVKAECPLCKQPFTSIFHNIRSNQHYDIYELPHQPSNPVDYNIFNYVSGPISSFTAPTHHLFSLSQPAFDADLTLSNFSRFQFRHRRYDRYLNPLTIHGEHPYSFSGPSVNPASHVSAATWPRGAEEFRRDVYRRNLGPPAVILGCENSTYRLTPAMVAASAHRIHRIMPWLTRELRVLLRSHQNVRLAISVIQPLLTQVTIDSMSFYDRVAPLIGRRSRQFVQEFVAFANSALSVQAYDRKAMYRRRDVVSAVPSSSSSTNSENDVVEVTDISPDVYPSGANANPGAPGPSQTQPLNLSRSGWDSPIAGPSWDSGTTQDSVIDRVSVSSESDDPVYRPDLRESDSDKSKAGSDIIFVKYDKPWNERSPINLTSDSDAFEGNESVRRKKKSKHKKKKKEIADNGEGCGSKKDKGKKSSSKSKHKDKSKSSSKAVVSDEEMECSSKRRHSQSSTEHHKVKKHKRSKSKRDKLSDREIVDRYFAQAMSQDKEEKSSEAEDQEVSISGKQKERSSSKEKSKKKKKSRKHSKDSHNQSNKHTCKKHHSGHKKSSNRLTDGLPEQHGRHTHTHSPVRQSQVGGPSRSDPMGNETINQHEASGSTISHSVVPGFQPPYLGMTDTVQHIPVNLWVSAWPALSVSHTYPPPPPIAIGQGIAQNSNTSSSTMTSNPNGTAESNRALLDRLSISSDSSSDSSDSESDDAQDLQIPSLQNVHSRTKQWLETNFPDLGRPQTTSTSVPSCSVITATSSSTNGVATTSTGVIGSSVPCSQNLQENLETGIEMNMTNKEKEQDVVEVVSIASGDDDVVVCSSEDSCSNVGDLWVIDVDDSNKKANQTKNASCSNFKDDLLGSPHISTLPFNAINPPENSVESTSGPSNIILPPVNKSFQPFKLQKKPAMAICGKDPFFPPMTHSSDEDCEVDNILQSTSSTSQVLVDEPASSQSTGLSSVSKANDLSNIDNLDDISSSATPAVASLTNILDTKEPMQISPTQSAETLNPTNTCQNHDSQKSSPTSLNTTSFTAGTSSMFSMLPPLTSSSHSTKPSSSISYLPYLSSILPYKSQSAIPAPPISLPLHFPPFPQIPLLSTTTQSNNSLLPSLYPSQSQVTSAERRQFLAEDMKQNDTNTQLQTHTTVNETSKERSVHPSKHQLTAAEISNSGNFIERTCLENEKRKSGPLGSSEKPLIQSESQNKDIVTSNILESETQHDNNVLVKETEKEDLSSCDGNKSHHYPVSENIVPLDVLQQHRGKDFNTAGSSFPRKSSPHGGTSDSSTVNIFTSESNLSNGFTSPVGNPCEKLRNGIDMSLSANNENSCILPTNSYSHYNSKPFDALVEKKDDCVLPRDSLSHYENSDKPFDAFYSSPDRILPPVSLTYKNPSDKPLDALDKSIDTTIVIPTDTLSHQQTGEKTSDAMDKESDTCVLPFDTLLKTCEKPFDAMDKGRDSCVLPSDTLSHPQISDKSFDVLDKSSTTCVIPTDSPNHNTSDKPFDALDDSSMSNDLPLSNALHFPVQVESSITSSTLDRFKQTASGPSLQPPLDHSVKTRPVSGYGYNSETTQYEVSDVFKPYSDNNDPPLHSFTDALASSDSDSDN